MTSRILSIDPGASGGIAWLDAEGRVDAAAMPDGMTAQVDALRALVAKLEPGTEAILEKVGFHRPGNSAVASCTFARHVGHLEAALYCLGVPTAQVSPQTWMKLLGTMPTDKGDRKRHIRELMQRTYPHLAVTLRTADALGILSWAIGRAKGWHA